MLLLLVLVVPALTQVLDCGVFQEGACPLEESNIVGNSGEATNAAECQVRLGFNPKFL